MEDGSGSDDENPQLLNTKKRATEELSDSSSEEEVELNWIYKSLSDEEDLTKVRKVPNTLSKCKPK